MQQNINAFQKEKLDAVIVNVAGCGAMMKDYSHIHHELTGGKADQPHASEADVAEFSGLVKDVSEFLMALGPVKPLGRIEAVVAYQDACHLQHAQKIRQQPRDLLELIPGVTLRPDCRSGTLLRCRRKLQSDSTGNGRSTWTAQSRMPDGGNAGCRGFRECRLFVAVAGETKGSRAQTSQCCIRWNCST